VVDNVLDITMSLLCKLFRVFAIGWVNGFLYAYRLYLKKVHQSGDSISTLLFPADLNFWSVLCVLGLGEDLEGVANFFHFS
jgi:hypothetical protein